jgi:hypothetical protein
MNERGEEVGQIVFYYNISKEGEGEGRNENGHVNKFVFINEFNEKRVGYIN